MTEIMFIKKDFSKEKESVIKAELEVLFAAGWTLTAVVPESSFQLRFILTK